jgi:outer membrane protein TolC
MNTILKGIFPILICFLIHHALFAEGLTLDEALSIALADNPGLKGSEWSIEAQKEEVSLSKGHLLPSVDMESRFMRTDNPVYVFMSKLNQGRFAEEDFMIDRLNNPDPLSDFQTAFSFEMPLFVPKIFTGIDLSKRELTAKQSDYERRKEAVALQVVQSFLAVQTAGEFADAARKGMAEAAEHSRLAGLRYEAGLGLYSDVLRADVAVKEAEAMLVQAESALEIARRALGLAMGRSEPVDAAKEKPRFELDDLEVYLRASMQRQDLQALQLRFENSEKAVKLERSVYLPEVGVGGSYQFNDHSSPFSADGQSYLFMVSLKWHLFDAGLFDRVRKAEAESREVAARLAAFEQEMNFLINRAYHRVQERQKNLAFAKTSVEKAEEALRIVRLAYRNEHAPLVDLLNTQVMLDRARAKAVEAENEHLAAMADLYFQSGLLMTALTGEPNEAG